MSLRNFIFVCALLVCPAGAAYAQPLAPAETAVSFSIVPLTLEEGFPLEVMLTQKLRYRLNEPVHGTVIAPVYAFDREVIPAGAEVVGRVTGFRKGGKWKRVSSMLGGDFTPVRDPQVTFDTLVLPDGTRRPIETSVAYGTSTVVQSASVRKQLKEALEASSNGGGQLPASTQALTNTAKSPGKDMVKGLLWSLAPYHPQSLPAGTRYSATLLKPLEFGGTVIGTRALEAFGSEPPAGSLVHARLVTPLDSRTAKSGDPVRALLTRPIFSADHLLIFPAGARLQGEVVQVRAARRWHRTGELTFRFTKIEPPTSFMSLTWPERNVQGQLVGAQVGGEMNAARITEEGAARISQSNRRFLAPAFGLFLSRGSFSANSDPLNRALLGAYGGSLLKRVSGGRSMFGLPGGVAARMIPPVGVGLAMYGVAHSVVVNFMARGQEITFPVNTPIEIRME